VQLSSTKSNSGVTLLHFLAKKMNDNQNAHADFTLTEWLHLESASKVDQLEVAKTLTTLRTTVKQVHDVVNIVIILSLQIEQAANTYYDNNDETDGYYRTVRPFCQRAHVDIDAVTLMQTRMIEDCNKMHDYYAQDAKYSTADILRDLYAFKLAYEVCDFFFV
jgi:hypothetical protein